MVTVRHNRVFTIALYTFREAVRQRFLSVLLVLALGFIGSATFFLQFNFGGSELKFIADFGWGVMFLFGSIVAIVTPSHLFFSEIEHRTAMTLLAKPLPRSTFLLGKLVGVVLLLAMFTALLVSLLVAILAWRASTMADFEAVQSAGQMTLSYAGCALMGMLQFLKLSLLSAITLFICSFSKTNLYAVILGFFVMLVCQLQYLARDHWGAIDFLPLRYAVLIVSKVFPNLQLFNVGEALLFRTVVPMPLRLVGSIGLYGLLYIVFFYLMAVWSFRKREI